MAPKHSRFKPKTKNSTLNANYPKAAYLLGSEDVIILRSAADLANVPDDYMIADPNTAGWGSDFEILISTTEQGSILIKYVDELTAPPTPTGCSMPELTFIPFETMTGSKADYTFRYYGSVQQPIQQGYNTLVSNLSVSRNNEWYSFTPGPDNNVVTFGYDSKIYDLNTGTLLFDADTAYPTLRTTSSSTTFVDPTGIAVVFSKNSDSAPVFYKLGHDGTPISSLEITPALVYDHYSESEFPLIAPLDTSSIIRKPQVDKYYLLETAQTYKVETSNGNTFNVSGTNLTLAVSIENGVTTLDGYIKNVPEGEVIEVGGMTSAMNWKMVEGTNDMYYTSYEALARIDTTTDTVVWWVNRPNDNDEVGWVLPNKNIILPGYGDYGYLIREYSYVDGSVVRTLELESILHGIFKGTPPVELDLQDIDVYDVLMGMVGTNDCRLYMYFSYQDANDVTGSCVTEVDLIDFKVIRFTPLNYNNTLTNPNPSTFDYQGMDYYAFSIIDSSDRWWFTHRVTNDDVAADSGIIGFLSYRNGVFMEHPFTAHPPLSGSGYDAFFFKGNNLIYGFNPDAIYQLEFSNVEAS